MAFYDPSDTALNIYKWLQLNREDKASDVLNLKTQDMIAAFHCSANTINKYLNELVKCRWIELKNHQGSTKGRIITLLRREWPKKKIALRKC